MHRILQRLVERGYRRGDGAGAYVLGPRALTMAASLLRELPARYIARNPVEAGLCDEPDVWAWGSHAATLGASGPPWLDTPRLLGFFGAVGGDARRRYQDFVALR